MFDSHVHYDHKRFDNGRDALLQKMHGEGLNYCLNAAIDFESNVQMRRMLQKYPWIFFASGIHPNAVEIEQERDKIYLEKLREWTKESRVKAIGETGLDYFRLEQMQGCVSAAELEQRKERQKAWFYNSIRLAEDARLPLVLHIRGGADEEALRILDEKRHEGMKGVVHCFSGNSAMAREYTERGFQLGIGGMITRDGMDDLRKAVKQTAVEKILLETDSPFVRPAGMGGKRNTSESLDFIAKVAAEIKGMRAEEIEKLTEENAKRLFGI